MPKWSKFNGTKKKAAYTDEGTVAKLRKLASDEAYSKVQAESFQEDYSSILNKRSFYNETKTEMEELFKMKIPIDFFDFYEFIKMRMEVDDADDADLEGYLARIGLRFGGMYDYLLGKRSESKEDYILHHRYYYDPPEFQTILIDSANEYLHIGYYRDDPNSNPIFIATSDASKDCKLSVIGNSVFSAVRKHLPTGDHLKGGAKSRTGAFHMMMTDEDPEAKQRRKKSMTELKWSEMLRQKFWVSLDDFMTRNNYAVNMKHMDGLKKRNKKIVSNLFHTGLVVPVNKEGIGWRPLPCSNYELKKILSGICEEKKDCETMRSELEEFITLVQFANDECDPGQGYALGLQLFTFGGEKLHGYIQSLLPMAYQLLDYPQFGEIFDIHMRKRVRTVPVYLK